MWSCVSTLYYENWTRPKGIKVLHFMSRQNFPFNAKFQHFLLFHLFLLISEMWSVTKKEELSFIQLGEAGLKLKGEPLWSELSSSLLFAKASLPALTPACIWAYLLLGIKEGTPARMIILITGEFYWWTPTSHLKSCQVTAILLQGDQSFPLQLPIYAHQIMSILPNCKDVKHLKDSKQTDSICCTSTSNEAWVLIPGTSQL